MARFVLNETSYHGSGAIKEIVTEVKTRGFKKAFVCSDPDLVKFNVTSKTKKYYENLGYKCKKGDTIQVNTKDLPRGSHVTEKRICDCCG